MQWVSRYTITIHIIVIFNMCLGWEGRKEGCRKQIRDHETVGE